MAKQQGCFAAQQSCAAKSFFAFRHYIIIIKEAIEMLPKDPMILLSVVNTKLRDEYDSLAALCSASSTPNCATNTTRSPRSATTSARTRKRSAKLSPPPAFPTTRRKTAFAEKKETKRLFSALTGQNKDDKISYCQKALTEKIFPVSRRHRESRPGLKAAYARRRDHRSRAGGRKCPPARRALSASNE